MEGALERRKKLVDEAHEELKARVMAEKRDPSLKRRAAPVSQEHVRAAHEELKERLRREKSAARNRLPHDSGQQLTSSERRRRHPAVEEAEVREARAAAAAVEKRNGTHDSHGPAQETTAGGTRLTDQATHDRANGVNTADQVARATAVTEGDIPEVSDELGKHVEAAGFEPETESVPADEKLAEKIAAGLQEADARSAHIESHRDELRRYLDELIRRHDSLPEEIQRDLKSEKLVAADGADVGETFHFPETLTPESGTDHVSRSPHATDEQGLISEDALPLRRWLKKIGTTLSNPDEVAEIKNLYQHVKDWYLRIPERRHEKEGEWRASIREKIHRSKKPLFKEYENDPGSEFKALVDWQNAEGPERLVRKVAGRLAVFEFWDKRGPDTYRIAEEEPQRLIARATELMPRAKKYIAEKRDQRLWKQRGMMGRNKARFEALTDLD